jgi:hypothetical protein
VWKIRCDGPGSAEHLAAALAKSKLGAGAAPQIERRGADLVVTYGYEKPPV